MSPIRIFTCISILMMSACAIPPTLVNQYTLDKYSSVSHKARQHRASIYIGMPEAIAAFQTDQMLYTNTPHEISAFAHNGWKSPPADMLYPLIQQSVQDSHYFRIVASGSHAEICHYRLDTELLDFKQNFLKKPSRFEISVKAMISNTSTDKVIVSKIFRESVRCPSDNPYGGVLAANQAVQNLTRRLTQFAITEVQHDSRD